MVGRPASILTEYAWPKQILVLPCSIFSKIFNEPLLLLLMLNVHNILYNKGVTSSQFHGSGSAISLQKPWPWKPWREEVLENAGNTRSRIQISNHQQQHLLQILIFIFPLRWWHPPPPPWCCNADQSTIHNFLSLWIQLCWMCNNLSGVTGLKLPWWWMWLTDGLIS